MIVLFESYSYRKEDIERYIPDWMLRIRNDSEQVSLPYVGYAYIERAGDAVFFLPKIFVDGNGLAFGTTEPSDLISPHGLSTLGNSALAKRLYSLSMWIYESVKIYRDSSTDYEVKLTEEKSAKSVISYEKGESSHTMMEIFFSFLDFHRENKELFIRRKYSANRGERICWHRTVSKVQPVIQDEVPYYPHHKASVQRIDYEEELLTLYYSVIEFFRKEFGYQVYTDPNYNLITGSRFTSLLEGKGLRKLRAIKNHYFSDTFVRLWKLLYLFFDICSEIKVSSEYEEVLITDNYPMVFESMIDSLIGDRPGKNGMKKFYSEQKDGKRVDHIYRDYDLFSDEHIYFIGDSKYYRSGSLASGESVEKQFTYAKNVIQYSTDPYSVRTQTGLRYRDDLTEGYNITPNFFISAVIDKDYEASMDSIRKIGKPEFSCQFKDRLFDRDTLTVHRYSINFLFVLSAYISRDGFTKDNFRKKARREFRRDIINYLNERYLLFRVYPDSSSTCADIVTANFRKYCGRMYALSRDSSFFIMAFERNEQESLESDTVQRQEELQKIKGVGVAEYYRLSGEL